MTRTIAEREARTPRSSKFSRKLDAVVAKLDTDTAWLLAEIVLEVAEDAGREERRRIRKAIRNAKPASIVEDAILVTDALAAVRAEGRRGR